MKIPIYQVDAFTSTLFEGNPAAVCPLRNWIDKNIMQKIAQENNLSETAFFVKKDNIFEIRWFTPVAELDLAGHPTLATTHVILKELKINLEKVVFKTNINDTLNVAYRDNLYLMDFPSRDPKVENNIDKIADALGRKPKELYKHRDAVAIFDTEDDIRNLYPDMEKLKKLDYPAVIVTAVGNNVDFVSRNFAPKLGIPEDPVTGSAHCELIPYWSKTLNKKELLAHQISNRGGKLYCTHQGDRVTIGGEAITFMRGEIEI
ncbi:MAG: isomerase [Candidatus Pelagibacter sp.]|nr:isomerase [Candidatus Pelagibacter sp.]